MQSYGSFLYYKKNLLTQAGIKPPPADLSDPSWTWDTMVDTALQHSIELSQHTFARWAEILAVLRDAMNPIWQNKATAAEALRAARPQLDQVCAQAYAEYQGTL